MMSATRDVDVNLGNVEGNTPLIGACWRGNPDSVRALLRHHPTSSASTKTGARRSSRRVGAGITSARSFCSPPAPASTRWTRTVDPRCGRRRARATPSPCAFASRTVAIPRSWTRAATRSAPARASRMHPALRRGVAEEFDAVRELLRGGADPFRGDSEGRTPISLVNRGSDAHTENTRRIREILDRYLDAAEAKPEMLDAARASYERRAASQRRQAERFAARARRAAEDAAEDAARREASLWRSTPSWTR